MSDLAAKITAVWLIRHGARNSKETDPEECLSDAGFAEARGGYHDDHIITVHCVA